MIKDNDLVALLKAIPALKNYPIRPDAANEADGVDVIVYQVVSLQDGAYTLTGIAGLVPWRYQIDVYSPKKSTVDTLSDAIVNGLYQSTQATLMNAHSTFENETKTHRVSLDMSIWFNNQS